MWSPQQLFAGILSGTNMPGPPNPRPGLLGQPPGNNMWLYGGPPVNNLWQAPFSPVYTGPSFSQLSPQNLNSPRTPSLMNQRPMFINPLANPNQRGSDLNGAKQFGLSYNKNEIKLAKKNLSRFISQSGAMEQTRMRLMESSGPNSWEGEGDTLKHIPIPFPLPPCRQTESGDKVWDPQKHSNAETPAKKAKLDDTLSSYDSDFTIYDPSDSEDDAEDKTCSNAENRNDLTGFLNSINSTKKVEPSTSVVHNNSSATTSKQSALSVTSASCSSAVGDNDDDSGDSDVEILKTPPKPAPEIIVIEDSPKIKIAKSKKKKKRKKNTSLKLNIC